MKPVRAVLGSRPSEGVRVHRVMRGHREAVSKLSQYHPRQWVEASSPAYCGALETVFESHRRQGVEVSNPAYKRLPLIFVSRRVSHQAALERSTPCRGWYSSNNHYCPCSVGRA